MREEGLKTMVLGASPDPTRYSYLAVLKLSEQGHSVIPVGIREGQIGGHEILVGKPKVEDVHTVTMYVGPQHQESYEDYILSLAPKRIVFNPGAENQIFAQKAQEMGIVVENACTLVLLSTGQYVKRST